MSNLLAEISAARQKLDEVDQLLARIAAAVPAEPDIPQNPSLIGLQNDDAFWEYIRGDEGELFPKITQEQVNGINAILLGAAGRLPASWCAYVLATAYHETAQKMQGVKEAYWCSEDWRKKNLKYYPWYGRGLVQLTWQENYHLATSKLKAAGYDVDLMKTPDLALRLDVSVFVIINGMLEGWFTGKKLNDYIPAAAEKSHFKAARKIINGTDKDELIAGFAVQFYEALKKGEWQ